MGEIGGGMYEHGAVSTDDVHWLAPPQHYEIDNPYVAYGNEVSADGRR